MSTYLSSSISQFAYYKSLGDKLFSQLDENDLFWKPATNDNTIAIIVNHIAGNMLSRWTNFLTTDGEKDWRNRDSEFNSVLLTREDVISKWEEGWTCLFNTLNSLQNNQIEDVIYIRNQGHSVTEAINRQLCHYSYHIGQMVFLGKMIKGNNWQSLSIPKGYSQSYNKEKFSKEKELTHFTSEYI